MSYDEDDDLAMGDDMEDENEVSDFPGDELFDMEEYEEEDPEDKYH